MSEKRHLSSLRRGLRALTLLNERRHITGTELARVLGIPRTTAHRVLATLVAEGFVGQDRVTHTYHLTERVCTLAAGFVGDNRQVQVAHTVLQRLAQQIPWPLAFATPAGDNVMVRTSTDYASPLAISRYAPGSIAPILHTTTGLCVLAFCSDSERAEILGAARKSADPRQDLVHRPAELNALLRKVRREGYCSLEYDYYQEGSFAVPVVDNGRVIGAMVLRYIKKALRPHEIITRFLPLLRAAAEEIAAGGESAAAIPPLRQPDATAATSRVH